MRIIIAGGRDFTEYKLLDKECNKIFVQLAQEGNFSVDVNTSRKQIEIICGKAKGADTLGKQFGKQYQLPIKYFLADWDGLGKKAGYIRNEQMAKYAEEDNGVLIAFWDKESRGTKHMIDLANKHGLKVFVVNY